MSYFSDNAYSSSKLTSLQRVVELNLTRRVKRARKFPPPLSIFPPLVMIFAAPLGILSLFFLYIVRMAKSSRGGRPPSPPVLRL